MKKITYKIYTLGCKVNQYDSSSLENFLDSVGFESGKNIVDLAVINTCAVTESAIRKALRTINIAKKENPDAKLILTGCVGELEKKRNTYLNRYFNDEINIDLIWGTKDYKKLVLEIKNLFNINNLAKAEFNYKKLVKNNKRSRYTIKIQDGCEQFCTYCVIPYTRGEISSRKENDIINEIEAVTKEGIDEIVLSGIHLGLYGKDLHPSEQAGFPLVNLIKKIIKLSGLGRIRLSSIELNEVTDELLKLIKTDKVCSHLHISLQSGCNKILKLMNRPYTLVELKNRIKEIRKIIPSVAITTDVIVGFPGENDKDFLETYNSVKEINFSRLHVFPFSAHDLTPASKFLNQIPENIKKERAKKLRILGYELAQNYRDKFKGQELMVIPEQLKNKKYLGKTEYYFDVWFDQNNLVNKNDKIKIKKLILIKK
ncbi:MAG: tRNA (N(6)-L-threonylcarbamoyladenosine(37)-C(2))-methylthiotransferase MtaB [Patescibacteria group bacterium]|nr:tRNA (N(6)-L-threonylcarbamoyladenosine(37)-C(2))-methylthiotransferase MtaB [Patescibacteria group bacterium]